MKKIITTTLFLFITQISHADIIRCSFTEPFYTTIYSMAQQSLRIESSDGPRIKIIKNVSFQILGPGKFELWDRNNKVIQKLSLTNLGSDGMSDYIYPYEAQWVTIPDMANLGFGGCESNFLKKKLETP